MQYIILLQYFVNVLYESSTFGTPWLVIQTQYSAKVILVPRTHGVASDCTKEASPQASR